MSVFFRFFTLFKSVCIKRNRAVFCQYSRWILQLNVSRNFLYALLRRALTIFNPLLATHQLHPHRKLRVRILTHLSQNALPHGKKLLKNVLKVSHFVREVTHFGSNESNGSLGVFCAITSMRGIWFLKSLRELVHWNPGLKHVWNVQPSILYASNKWIDVNPRSRYTFSLRGHINGQVGFVYAFSTMCKYDYSGICQG